MPDSKKTLDKAAVAALQREISSAIEDSEDRLFTRLDGIRRQAGVSDEVFDVYVAGSEYGTDHLVDGFQCWREE